MAHCCSASYFASLWSTLSEHQEKNAPWMEAWSRPTLHTWELLIGVHACCAVAQGRSNPLGGGLPKHCRSAWWDMHTASAVIKLWLQRQDRQECATWCAFLFRHLSRSASLALGCRRHRENTPRCECVISVGNEVGPHAHLTSSCSWAWDDIMAFCAVI